MWEVITNIVTKRETCSLILTTHSMEEAEALCTRVGIMVGGVLRALGSSQRLRTRYGHGYQIEIGFHIPDSNQISTQEAILLNLLNDSATGSNKNSSKVLSVDMNLTKQEILEILNKFNKKEWITRIEEGGSATDIIGTFEFAECSIDSTVFICVR